MHEPAWPLFGNNYKKLRCAALHEADPMKPIHRGAPGIPLYPGRMGHYGGRMGVISDGLEVMGGFKIRTRL